MAGWRPGCRSAQCPAAVHAGAQLGRGSKTLLQDAGAAQLQPLVGKSANHTIAQRAARNQQQRGLFPLLVDMSGGVTRFVFRRKREIAEVSAAFDFSGWLRASTLSGVLLLITSSTFSFSNGPTTGGAILLRTGEQLAYRLAGGVVNFQFRRRVGGGCDHGLRLCGRRGNRLGGRGSGSLRRGGCCRRPGCRFRSRRCPVLRRGLNRISAASGGGKIADFCLRRTHHIIITGDIRRPGDWAGTALPVTDGAPFLAASKPCWIVRPKIDA